MIDIIISGLIDVLGLGHLVGLLFVLAFIMLLVSRGAGVTSMLGVGVLAVYLFGSYDIAGTALLADVWLYTIMLLAGLFMGFVFYVLFWRE